MVAFKHVHPSYRRKSKGVPTAAATAPVADGKFHEWKEGDGGKYDLEYLFRKEREEWNRKHPTLKTQALAPTDLQVQFGELPWDETTKDGKAATLNLRESFVRLLNKPVGRRFDEDRIESEVIGPLPWKRSAADETPISVKNPGTARNNAHLVGQEGVRAKSYIDQGWVVDIYEGLTYNARHEHNSNVPPVHRRKLMEFETPYFTENTTERWVIDGQYAPHNIGSKINDYRLTPTLDRKSQLPNITAINRERKRRFCNVFALPVLARGIPYVCYVASRFITAREPIITDYGNPYWRYIKDAEEEARLEAETNSIKGGGDDDADELMAGASVTTDSKRSSNRKRKTITARKSFNYRTTPKNRDRTPTPTPVTKKRRLTPLAPQTPATAAATPPPQPTPPPPPLPPPPQPTTTPSQAPSMSLSTSSSSQPLAQAQAQQSMALIRVLHGEFMQRAVAWSKAVDRCELKIKEWKDCDRKHEDITSKLETILTQHGIPVTLLQSVQSSSAVGAADVREAKIRTLFRDRNPEALDAYVTDLQKLKYGPQAENIELRTALLSWIESELAKEKKVMESFITQSTGASVVPQLPQ